MECRGPWGEESSGVSHHVSSTLSQDHNRFSRFLGGLVYRLLVERWHHQSQVCVNEMLKEEGGKDESTELA